MEKEFRFLHVGDLFMKGGVVMMKTQPINLKNNVLNAVIISGPDQGQHKHVDNNKIITSIFSETKMMEELSLEDNQ